MLKFFRNKDIRQSDEELLLQYQKSGDLEVLGLLYDRYLELVYGTCLKFFKDPPLAEDAVMSIFETLISKAQTQEIRQFRPWLHVVAKNHCLMSLRKKDNIVPMEDFHLQSPSTVVYSDEAMHPWITLEHNEEESALKDCIESLSETQKSCVSQFYLEGKSYQEIAEMSEQSLGTVRSNIQNGRRNLRICMEKKLARSGEKKAEKR
jgi:RNA polymerase sigma-70 factor (ECF subfamily)